MKRRLFNLAAALSLVLCLATAALWVRSYYVSDQFGYTNGGPWIGMTSERAGISLAYKHYHNHTLPNKGLEYRASPRPSPRQISTFLGFFYWNGSGTGITFWELIVPLWFIAVLVATFATLWLWNYDCRRRWVLRWRAGLCPTCGYDLRATPDRCPECGIAAATPTPAPAR
jgi:hypothetical protein